MIKEVMDGTEYGGADFAVADLSITSQRASVVDFSMPFMTLGLLNSPQRVLMLVEPFLRRRHLYSVRETAACQS
jgi:hypothetical protein